MKGTVGSFDKGRGYGFIKGDDGRQYLVHFLAIRTAGLLVAGSRVEFTAVETPRGPQADDVSVVTT